MQAAVLDVVIASFRCRELLRQCLESLDEHRPSRGMRVWVVDNASGDGTVEMIHTEFPDVELIAATANLGFARANNAAIRRASAPYVLALNPDTRMTAGALDQMLELMEREPSIGISGCRLEREDGTFDHAARRSFPTPIGALGHFMRIGRSDRAPGWLAQYRAPDIERGVVDAVNGAFMLMRRSTLDEVGLFDEGYWLYMEDLDLCYRFRQAGWLVWYEPDATVVHAKAGSSGRYRSPRANYAFHYGMYRFYRKHYAGSRSGVVNVAVYAAIGAKVVSSIARNGLRAAVAHARRATAFARPAA